MGKGKGVEIKRAVRGEGAGGRGEAHLFGILAGKENAKKARSNGQSQRQRRLDVGLGGGGGGVVVWHLESGVGCCGLGQGKRCLPCLMSCLVQGCLQALMPALLKFILPFQPCPKNRKPASIVFPQDPKIPHYTSQGNSGERCSIVGPEAKSLGERISTRDNKTRESPFVAIPCQEQSISPSVLRWTTSGPVPCVNT